MAEEHNGLKEGYIISVLDSKYQCLFCDSEYLHKTEVNNHIYNEHVTMLENDQIVDSHCIYCNSSFQDFIQVFHITTQIKQVVGSRFRPLNRLQLVLPFGSKSANRPGTSGSLQRSRAPA